jgi:hypothetical protein
MTVNELISRNRVVLEDLVVAKLLKNFPFLWNQNFNYCLLKACDWTPSGASDFSP